MAKLVCDFGVFSDKSNKIKSLIENYKSILNSLTNVEEDIISSWNSQSQKVYTEKFLNRKQDLEQLAIYYDELVAFLNQVLTKYQNIESKYS